MTTGSESVLRTTWVHRENGEILKNYMTQLTIPDSLFVSISGDGKGQDVPTLTKDDEGKIVVKKRHYARRTVVSESGKPDELDIA